MFQGAVKTVVLRHAVASTAGGTSVAAPKRVIGACLKKGRTPFSLLSSRLSSRGVRPGCRRTFSSDATTKKGVLTQEQQRTAAIVGGTVALALIGYSFGKSAGKRRGGSTQELPTAALLPKLAQIAESSSDKEELARLENNSLEVFLAVKRRQIELGFENVSDGVVVNVVPSSTSSTQSSPTSSSLPSSAPSAPAASSNSSSNQETGGKSKLDRANEAARAKEWLQGRALLNWNRYPNPVLIEHASVLGLSSNGAKHAESGTSTTKRKRILVPFCGYSQSLEHLAFAYGNDVQVVGVDPLSPFLKSFASSPARKALGFQEVEVDPAIDVGNAVGTVLTDKDSRIILVQCDISGLEQDKGKSESEKKGGKIFGDFDAIYDEAGLNSLPAYERQAYLSSLAAMMRPGSKILMNTLEWNTGAVEGGEASNNGKGSCPPYSVETKDVVKLARSAGLKPRLLRRRRLPLGTETEDNGASAQSVFTSAWVLER